MTTYRWRYAYSFLLGAIAIFFVGLVSIMRSHLAQFTTNNPVVLPHVSPPAWKKVVLSNGLTVVACRYPIAPKVLVQIGYDVGSAHEQGMEKGYAHLLEHMIFKGTQSKEGVRLSEADIDFISRSRGASYNAYTTHDITSYYFEVDKDNWVDFLFILADCMEHVRLDKEHLSSEIFAVIQELKMYKDKYTRAMIDAAITEVSPQNHPYHDPVIGYKEDLASVTSEKLKDFYRKYYSPGQAVLYIVGDIDIQNALEKAEEMFGHIPAGTPCAKADIPPLDIPLCSSSKVVYEPVEKGKFLLAWPVAGAKDVAGYESFNFLSTLLGQGEGSLLQKRLVDELFIAEGIGAYVIEMTHASVFLVFVEPRDGCEEQCKNEVYKIIAEVAQNGCSDSFFERTKMQLACSYVHGLQSISQVAHDWLSSYLATKDESVFWQYPERLKKVTKEEVINAAKLLDPLFVTTVELKPLPEGKKGKWEEVQKKSDDLDRAILSHHRRVAPLEEPVWGKKLGSPHPTSYIFPTPSRSFSLSNGMDVILTKDDTLPVIETVLRCKDAGYISRAKEQVGRELMMSLLIEGTTSHSKEELVSFLEKYGVECHFDAATASFSLVGSEAYTSVSDCLFHILTSPSFSSDAVEKVKEIFIQNYRLAQENPSLVAKNLLEKELYPDHPFGWDAEWAISEIKSYNPQNLKSLHKQVVVPSAYILSIGGDIDLDKMERYVRDKYGAWKQEAFYTPLAAPVPQPRQPKEVQKQLLRDQLVLYWGVPSNVTYRDERYIPLRLLSIITFSSLGSRLYALREKEGLFYTARGDFATYAAQGFGYDYISTIITPDKKERVKTLLQDMVENLVEHGITEEELSSAKRIFIKSVIDKGSCLSTKTSTFAALKEMGLPEDWYAKIMEKAESVTTEELNILLKEYLFDKKMTHVYVGRVE